ncbi:MAG TPA: septal ring lytic transglycosylase RlpA family protein [Candidatus Sulfopaludibacter sp.]|nr:septal ring lytic transglycosylase RlpA family protein [Candidatus Sulfopaludibacter sp.]
MPTQRVLTAAILAFLLTSCAHHRRTARNVPSPPAAAIPQPGYTETGIASWYGHPYHGRPAADGEIYDMETMVAAHRTLPFNTWVRVSNLSNNQSVEVRIIDRGPFIDGRIIDLSHAAAIAIGMIVSGTTEVRMEVIRAPETAAPALFAVQVGAFRERSNADRVRAEMESRYGAARLLERPENPGVWRVIVGGGGSQDAADSLAQRIHQETGEKNAFVVRLN